MSHRSFHTRRRILGWKSSIGAILVLATAFQSPRPIARAWSPNQHNREQPSLSRRDALHKFLVAGSIVVARPGASAAKDQTGTLTISEVANLLHSVPTFTIVDKKGN